MEFFKRVTHIDFLGYRWFWLILSIALTVLSVVGIAVRGLNFSIDYTGGVVVEASYQEPIDLVPLREAFVHAGYEGATLQYYGTTKDVLVRLPPSEDISSEVIRERVSKVLGDKATIRRLELVGPQVGKELANNGGLAFFLAVIGILVYTAMRFEFKYAVGAVAALLHDIITTLGVLAWFQVSFDLPALAAILTVLGYSINDTIVIFDRIRENFGKQRKPVPIEVMNLSINETLSRSVITHGVTLLSVLSLLFLGGEVLRSFSVALTFGIIFGTYSSIYIASALALMMGVSKESLASTKLEDKPKAQV